TEEIKLIGEHNLENVCAAVTTVWFSLSEVEDQIKIDAMQKVLSSFSGLEHRLEFVRKLDNVEYYDDSFGTTPDTAIVAMKAFVEPKVMIVGGHDKGLTLDKLVEEIIKQRVRHVIAIGTIGPKIAELLTDQKFTNVTTGLKTMDKMVAKAREVAQAGDVV